MGFIADLLRSRVLPALVAALGVSFIAAGLLTYTTGSDLDLFPVPSGIALATEQPDPTIIVGPTDSPDPSFSPLPVPTVALPTEPVPSGSSPVDVLPSPLTTPAPTATQAPNATPVPTAKPTPAPTVAPNRIATRVVVPALEIDLAIVKPPGGSTTYPLCNVAMYLQNLHQPGQGAATYLYAHARVGMFLPLLDQSKINNGRAMIGMLVQVYTSDNQYFLYEITEVRRHQLTLTDAIAAKDEELWLQTSEGPKGTPGKLQVVAMPLSNGPAEPSDAHPTPHPVVCD